MNEVFIAFATMFLAMLATLERNELLKPESEVKNIGAVMGTFIRFINDLQPCGIKWDKHDPKIKAYAAKHGIKIIGLNDPIYEQSSDDVEIPEATADANDPWGWKKTYRKLKNSRSGLFGGDSKDITSWTPTERKRKAFDNKDPLSRSAINQIKAGGIMELA